jgi:arginine:pyruvate transaminase
MAKFDLSLGTIAPALASGTEAWKKPLVAYGTSGASMGLTAALATLSKDCVLLLPRPYYPAYPNVAKFLGLAVGYYELTRGRPLVEAVVDAARGRSVAAILVNTPGNPLGNIATTADMTELEKVARDAGATLLVDETYAGILLDHCPDAWSGAGAVSGTIRIKSLSKAHLIAGERVGYVVAVPPVAEEIEEAHWVLAMSPAIAAQTNAARALLEETPERLVRLCARLRRSRDNAVAALAEVPSIELDPPPAGVFLWISFPETNLTGVEIARHCRQNHDVAVMPGDACGQRSPPAIRVSFALGETEASEAFHALAGAVREMSATSGIARRKR